MIKVAIDTNVLVYLLDRQDSAKHEKAKFILIDCPIISNQVVSEFINVAKRLLQKTKLEVIEKCTELIEYGELVPVQVGSDFSMMYLSC
jgi:predicted nucleic acid-binding protein